jgi:hypothetical protein
MSADELDRTKVTFSQAEGLEPLPQPLKLGEVSHALRNKIWKTVRRYMKSDCGVTTDFNQREYIYGDWKEIIKSLFVEYGGAPSRYNDGWDFNEDFISRHIFGSEDCEVEFNKVFDFVQFIMRSDECPEGVVDEMREAFSNVQAAYDIVISDDIPTIVPRTTPEEGEAIKQVFLLLEEETLKGARTHLRKACDELNAGKYADSVRESIHAVEWVARKLSSKDSSTLAPALDALDKKVKLHGSLKEGMKKLYGYTSDEKGIRHSLTADGDAKVDLTDATFMFGACASFVGYLINKGRAASLLDITEKLA